MRDALTEIAEMRGKTLLGYERGDEGAHAAFNEAAGIARAALETK